MIRIVSEAQYYSIIAGLRKKGYGFTNCCLLPMEIRRKINDRILLFLPIEKGMLLLEDVDNFYRCCFFLSESAKYSSVDLDRDAVIEFPFTRALNDHQNKQILMISDLGFQLGRESVMMSADRESLVLLHESEQKSFICETATLEDISQIAAILKDCFNPLYAFLPNKIELEAIVQHKEALVIHEGKHIAAVLISKKKGNSATISQVAVRREYRGKGLGKTILDTYHRQYQKEIKYFRHWVDSHNMPAIKMYQGAGYGFTLRKANEYIKIRKGGKSL